MSIDEIPPREVIEFVALIEREEFYEAHEVLEDLWVIEVPPLKQTYKGLIMAAVALCHWQRGNHGSTRRMFDAALMQLDGDPVVEVPGLRLAEFVATLRTLRTLLVTHQDPPWAAIGRPAWRPLRLRSAIDESAFPN